MHNTNQRQLQHTEANYKYNTHHDIVQYNNQCKINQRRGEEVEKASLHTTSHCWLDPSLLQRIQAQEQNKPKLYNIEFMRMVGLRFVVAMINAVNAINTLYRNVWACKWVRYRPIGRDGCASLEAFAFWRLASVHGNPQNVNSAPVIVAWLLERVSSAVGFAKSLISTKERLCAWCGFGSTTMSLNNSKPNTLAHDLASTCDYDVTSKYWA